MPNNIDNQRELIMRQILNSYNSIDTFNNIINTINQQDLVNHDLISNIRPFNRERRYNRWNNSILELNVNNQQNQIRPV